MEGDGHYERRRARVYVAGPISSDPMTGVYRATAVSRQMFLDGLAPFVPHWDVAWHLGPEHWNGYLEFDLEYVAVCDAVYRLRGESRGADKECAVALTLGIPIFYQDLCETAETDYGYTELLGYFAERSLTGVRKL